MKNTVTVEKKIISRLKIATFVLFIFCCLMIFMLVCTKMVQNQNLNGKIYERTGEITKIDEQDGVDYITLKIDDKTTYEFNSVLGDEFDWQPYLNQTVTVIVPQQTFAWSNPWILGLKDDEKVIVDYNTVLEQKRQENSDMVIVSAILTGVLAAATLAAFIWRVNITPTVESPLDKQFAEFAYDRQPTCPERKTFTIVTCVYAAFIIILGMLCSILTSTTGEDKLNTTGIVLISVFGFVAVFGAVVDNSVALGIPQRNRFLCGQTAFRLFRHIPRTHKKIRKGRIAKTNQSRTRSVSARLRRRRKRLCGGIYSQRSKFVRRFRLRNGTERRHFAGVCRYAERKRSVRRRNETF